MSVRPHRGTALERNQAAARSLSGVARQLRFVKSRRNKIFEAAGLAPRTTDRVFRLLFAIVATILLVMPNLVSMLYFGLLASDQFESETRFAVRTSEPLRKNDQLADASGIPSALIAQDSQIIVNYITSRALIERLGRQFDLKKMFGRDDIDWYARLRGDASMEDVVDYWQDMADAGVATSGIITVKVKAFSSAEAHNVTKAIVTASEELVNEMNDRIWHDTIDLANEEVESATKQLSNARITLQNARNKFGMLSVDSTSASLSALLTQLQGETITLESNYNSKKEMVSTSAPFMRVLANQIEVKKRQIEDLKSQIASNSSVDENLADRSKEFSELELEQKLAENRLAASITALEQLQYLSQQKLIYLDPFLEPTTPDEARHPRRLFGIGLVLALSLLAFSVVWAILSTVRARID